MFKAFSVITKYDFLTTLNGLFFYLQKAPIIGKKISNNIYKFGANIVEAAPALKIILMLVKSFLGKLLYYIFLLYVSRSFVSDGGADKLSTAFFAIFLIYNIGGTAFLGSQLLTNDIPKYTQIKMIGIKPKEYYLFQLIAKGLLDAVLFAFVFGKLFAIGGHSFMGMLSTILFLLSLRMLYYYINLFMYRPKSEKPYLINIIVSAVIFLLSLGIILYSIFFGDMVIFNMIETFLVSPTALIIGGLLFIISSLLIFRTDKLDKMTYQILKASIFNEFKEAQKNVRTSEVKIKKMDETIELGKFEDYHGIEYINKIFFDRTKSILKKKILIRCAILLLITLITNGVALYLPKGEIIKVSEVDSNFRTMGLLIIYIGYFFYLRDHFTKFTFFNMDINLMKYNFYRSPKILDESIKYRFKKSLQLNFPMLIFLLLLINSIYFTLGGRNLTTMAFLSFTSCVAMVFFSTHYLYMYYLIQPFTAQLEVKNIAYQIVNGGLYLLLYTSSIFLGAIRLEYVLGILLFTIIYIIVGFILVKKYAYKRFKLR